MLLMTLPSESVSLASPGRAKCIHMLVDNRVVLLKRHRGARTAPLVKKHQAEEEGCLVGGSKSVSLGYMVPDPNKISTLSMIMLS